MTIGRRLPITSSLPSSATPYPEKVDRRQIWLDRALLNLWGHASSHLLAEIGHRRRAQLIQRVKAQDLTCLSDRQLRDLADELRQRLISTGLNLEGLASAFAIAREATRRHTGMRHFDVQLLGGAAMMDGAVAEMKTGEGKSLTALLPAVAAALVGLPVHIITVNDYLARRDAEQFYPVYAALGLSVGLVVHDQEARQRQQAYACDVTYCTNKELVFDYLRDRLALGGRRARARLLVNELFKTGSDRQPPALLLRGLHFAIVDEADSVLIDEARTPLILSGVQADIENDSRLYDAALDIARRLVEHEDYHVLANEKAIKLSAAGERQLTRLTAGRKGLWAIRRAREELVRQGLSALHLFRRDAQYIVADGKVQIVDEYTGRVMPDRSWEHGLHQLIEAKESCAITERHRTLDRITYQRFFRRYLHLCGMTGTATETAGELRAVYGLQVVRIPTNRPLRRMNSGTRMFRTSELKWSAVVESACAASRANRAVLIGTRSVDASEHVGALLIRAGLRPVILNARQDRQEAEIVGAAGQPGRVTVATNMAGRGTDIKLDPMVKEAGGLHVVLTEYHESSRIDRQLFGRAGRQGDPGSYESIVALDDELFRRFTPRYLQAFLRLALQQRKELRPSVAGALRVSSQRAAERLHARVRRETLSEDERLNRTLGFAGAE
jgi:preprotein translocase subunit SecA